MAYGEGCATLGQVIDHLRGLPQDMVVKEGFAEPHSYRGYYEDLSFEPAQDVTVGQMLACAEHALNRAFTGYKGGDFTMSEHTDCWLAEYGCSGIPIVLPTYENDVYRLPPAEGES